MKDKLSNQQTREKILEFFSNTKNKTPKDVKKIKRLAMKHNFKLGEFRKKFCKKCYIIYDLENSKMTIKNGFKTVVCENCKTVSRWKIKS